VAVNGFFEPLPPLPDEAEERHRPPPWFGPPPGTLPGVVAIERVVARTEKAAVCVMRVGAYPTGFELDLVTMTPSEHDALDPLLFGPPHRRPGTQHDGLPPEMLRFGVQFADGGKATNIAGFPSGDPAVPPAGPVMVPGGGGGGAGRWHQSLWVWPLPPRGPVLLVCEWPAAAIALTHCEIDSGLIIDAAARAQVVFFDDRPPEPPAGAGPPPVSHSG